MNAEKAVAGVALAWLISGVILLTLSVRRGRALSRKFAAQFPEKFEELGQPCPSVLPSVHGSRFAQFLAAKEYLELADSSLRAQFDDHRKRENRLLVLLLLSLGVVGGLIFWVKYVV